MSSRGDYRTWMKTKLTSRKSSMAFDLPNIKIPGPDAQPHTAKSIKDHSLLLNIRKNPDLTLRRWHYHSIQQTKPRKIINNGATTHHHTPPQTHDDQRFSPSKLCKSVHNFTKLTLWGLVRP